MVSFLKKYLDYIIGMSVVGFENSFFSCPGGFLESSLNLPFKDFLILALTHYEYNKITFM